MSKDEHIRALRLGVRGWNDWRSSHPDEVPDFTGADLTGIDLCAVNAPDSSGDYVVANLDPNKSMIRADLRACNFSFACLNHAKLTGADLDGSNFTGAQMIGAELSQSFARRSIFYCANLEKAVIRFAAFYRAHLSGANLSGSDLTQTDISQVEASGAVFDRAILRDSLATNSAFVGASMNDVDFTYSGCVGADFSHAKLRHAVFHGTNLQAVRLIDVDLSWATLKNCSVNGVAAWDLVLDGTTQSDLIITKDPLFEKAVITVDDIQIAHFLYLLTENRRIRDVIDSVTTKVVLILGRFSPSCKSVLDAAREALKQLGYVPVMFDFEKPSSRDLTETIVTIAHLSRFILVDLSEAKSVPQELSSIIPFLPSVPVQPVVRKGDRGYAMFEHFRSYPWVLPECVYHNTDGLVQRLADTIIPNAERYAASLKK